MKSFEQYLALVNQAIAGIQYPAEPDQLYEPIAYHMDLGGKRLRPVLTLMACDAMGGDVQEALPLAVGIELFHNFTLLHDDVMDQADVRRGKPTVHRRWSTNTAILCGDTMLTMATQHIARAPLRCLPQAIELFNKTAIDIYEGQQWDMDFEHRSDVTVDDYMMMIRLKTSVLLGCACQMGAMVAAATPADGEAFYNAGINLGLAFQLQDDLLDVWGDPKTFGKEIGGDIMSNKKTFLLINAIQLASDEDATELRRWINDAYAMRDFKVPAVTAIYERLGVRKLAEQAIAKYSNLALEAFNAIGMDADSKLQFSQLTQQLVGRSH